MSTAPTPQHPAAIGSAGSSAHRRGTFAEPPKRPARTALWVWTAVLSVLVLVIALVIVLQVTAGAIWDEAREAYTTEVADAAAAQDDLVSTASADGEVVTNAQAIAAAAPDGLVDTAARAALQAAAGTLSAGVDDAQALTAGAAADDAPAKPVVFWEQLAGASGLRADTAALDDRQARLSSAGDDLDAQAAAVDQAAAALYASAATSAPAFEAAHIDARNDPVIAFRDATDAVAGSTGVSSGALDAMSAYAAAASAVVSSEQEEVASIAGPLADARRAVQAFARSIDGGVLVEFDWAPTVNGYGEGTSVSGYTTWNYDHGGHAVILLSDSVAELWPSSVSQNLVAHEVGHAISSKCPTLYDDQDQASIEAFATAWAISKGYTGDGNGVSIYGQPSDALIAKAATCR